VQGGPDYLCAPAVFPARAGVYANEGVLLALISSFSQWRPTSMTLRDSGSLDSITLEMSVSDHICFGAGQTKRLADSRSPFPFGLHVAVRDFRGSNRDGLILSAAKTSTKEAKQMGPSFV
jgi:hypothetical protein